jgi:hypothetical protein
MTIKNKSDISQEIQQKIAISMIGSGTIEKQFIRNYLDKNPSATADEINEAYKHLVDDVTRAYLRAGYGSKKLVRYLFEVYGVMVTEKTVLSWLRNHGATIQPPTWERERIIRSGWERERVGEIERLEDDVEALKKCYRSRVDELVACESELRMCEMESRSLTRRLEGCKQEITEIILQG